MRIVKVAKNHTCITCGQIIEKGGRAFVEYFDAGKFAGRYYHCVSCSKVILKQLQKEINKKQS